MNITRGKEIADMVFEAVVTIAIIMFLVLLAGCSLAPQAVKTQAASGVNKYCATFTYEQRSGVLRPEFNTLIAPNKISVFCYGDPENPKKTNEPN